MVSPGLRLLSEWMCSAPGMEQAGGSVALDSRVELLVGCWVLILKDVGVVWCADIT